MPLPPRVPSSSSNVGASSRRTLLTGHDRGCGLKHWVRNVAAVVPAPAWFIALDLLLAYLPMAWLAILVGRRLSASGSRADA